MNKTIIATLALAGLIGAGAFAGTAMAADRDSDEEAKALQDAKVSLTQAIMTAEQQTGGRAYDAGIHASNGQTRIVVETSGPAGVQTLAIDAQTGKVVDSHSGGEPD